MHLICIVVLPNACEHSLYIHEPIFVASKQDLNVAHECARLEHLTLFELRQEWRWHHRLEPPKRLSRDLLVRGIAYRMQEKAFGGLSGPMLRKLKNLAAEPMGGGPEKPAQHFTLKPGTRLVREWQGVTHTVLVHADCVEWNGERYRSLTEVARKITGAHWSGPRFFGLRKRSNGASDSSADEQADG